MQICNNLVINLEKSIRFTAAFSALFKPYFAWRAE